jgi:hypothetical protein
MEEIMKNVRHTIMASCAAVALMGGSAYADGAATPNGWYTGLSGDATWMRNSEMGGGGNIDFGYQFASGNWGDLRAEGEAGYHAASGDSGHGATNYWTYMGNLYYDLPGLTPGSQWDFVPYVGAGLGDATVHFGDVGTSHHDDVFAYQFMAGVSLIPQSAPNSSWSLGYKYLGSDDSNYTDILGRSGEDRLSSSNIEVGYQYHF